MSFGLLKHFKDKKTESTDKLKSVHFKHVILGHDLGAVLKLLEVRKSFPDDSVRLITTRLLNRQLLIENYEYGVSQIRSPMMVENLYKKYHDAKISPQRGDVQFYKDGKFHDFGGRAKSMELKDGESFFSNKGYRIQLESFFNPEDWKNLDQILNELSEIRLSQSIEKTTPEDLVEKEEWLLSFKDFSRVTCEKLYVSISPKKFINFLTNKEKLTPEIIDVGSATISQAAISVTWKLNKEIYSEDRTLFIPQSMTHEWGHFIVEFENYNFQTKEQIVHVLFLIHDEEPQSEDLAQKIKLMKRVLDRVFNNIEQHIVKEYIRFDEDMFISGIKDSAIEQVEFDYPTLKFIGQANPMPAMFSNEYFLSRILS